MAREAQPMGGVKSGRVGQQSSKESKERQMKGVEGEKREEGRADDVWKK